jgi:hypothetical protein
MCGLQKRSGRRGGEKNLFLPKLEPRPLGRHARSRYTDCSIRASKHHVERIYPHTRCIYTLLFHVQYMAMRLKAEGRFPAGED